MKSVMRTARRLAVCTVGVLSLGVMQSAMAAGTLSGTSVNNRASVDYDVGGVAQTAIESSPAGNSTPGAGNGLDTSFVVDNRVDLTVAETDAVPTGVNPGQPAAVTTFTVTNDGNTAQDYALTPANLPNGTVVHGNTDDQDVNNVLVFVDANGNGTYEAGTDTATFIDSLAPDATVSVFVVVDVPIGATNGQFANVSLIAVTHDAGSGAASVTTETAGADNPGAVDVVFGDAGTDGQETDNDGYAVSSAQLVISKASSVISDPFNGTTDPKAIPGAVMEYSVTVNNTGAVSATSVMITDVLDPNVTLLLGQYNGGASDVQVTIGTAAPIFCTADAGDADTDGCGLTGGTLEVNPGITVGTVAADNPAVVLFQVTIQ